MFVIFKFALLTCAFYLMISALLELAILAAMYFHWIGMIVVRGSWRLFIVLFGAIWLVSLYCSGRIMMALSAADSLR